ncbi:MAG: T9SS type A sorting domain-containing protein [Saprospiraceae bacterium]|nr:T9SS type A sorting domain-containing protein [Saprospiraceae bacterium]
MTYEDQVYYFANNNACFKILRFWTIIDWCQIGSDGKHLTWSFEQEIKVVDNTAPVITSSTTERVVCTFDGECASGVITGLTASATDCTPDSMLVWTYVIYDRTDTPEVIYSSGIGKDVSGTYPVGKYRVQFTVQDRCGNLANTGYNFEIRNCKAPTAICKLGLSTSVTMMPDGNGGMAPMAMIDASFFDNKSYHVCNYDLKYSFSADTNDTIRTFDCSQLGERAVSMWVTDVNGNTSFCNTFIDVQDSLGLCTGNRVFVNGTILTDINQEVSEVQINLNDGEGSPAMTDENGQYEFTELPSGVYYTFRPEKDGDDINGISTLDIVMIQRHILGLQPLENPYRIIAADVNKSGSVSAADLIELRKLILGVISTHQHTDSWRFVDRNYAFPDISNPWVGQFPEQCALPVTSNTTIDYVAIKVGDVNGSATGTNAKDETLDRRSVVRFESTNHRVSGGTIVQIPFRASQSATIYGFQQVLETSGVVIRSITPGVIKLRENEVLPLNAQKWGMAVSIPDGVDVQEGDLLFTIEAEALRSGSLAEMISLSGEVRPEIYTEELTEDALQLSWRNAETSGQFGVSNLQPNPWKDQTRLVIQMPETSMVSLKIRDYTGRKVVSRIEQLTAGENTIAIMRDELRQAGVYFYELKYGKETITGKMILID